MSGNVCRCILLLAIISAITLIRPEFVFAHPSVSAGELETIHKPFNHSLQGKSLCDASARLPVVLYFYAQWCRYSLAQVPQIRKIQQVYGTRVTLVCIDVEDPLNKTVIDEYQVNPIPCAIYVDSQNRIIGYDIGFSDRCDLESRIRRLFLQDIAIRQ